MVFLLGKVSDQYSSGLFWMMLLLPNWSHMIMVIHTHDVCTFQSILPVEFRQLSELPGWGWGNNSAEPQLYMQVCLAVHLKVDFRLFSNFLKKCPKLTWKVGGAGKYIPWVCTSIFHGAGRVLKVASELAKLFPMLLSAEMF